MLYSQKSMKLLARIFTNSEKRNRRKTLVEYQEEMVGKLGKEQFEKLAKRGHGFTPLRAV